MYIQNKPQVKSAVNAIIRAKTVGEVPEMYVCASEISYVPRRHRMCLGDFVCASETSYVPLRHRRELFTHHSTETRKTPD